LLNQTSGLPEGAGESVIADSDNRPDANERQIRKLSKLKIDYPVGSKVAYCNLNYNILGLVIEAASGQPYTDYLQTHIFNPLNMSRSCDSKERAQKNGLAMGFRHWFGFPFPASNLPIPHGSLPAGQLISTSEDMANYLIAHLNGGRFLDKQILSKTGIDELHRGELEYVKMGISAGKYGMGWFEIDMGKIKTFSHGGNVPDFSSFMVIIPSQKIGLVLLFNSDPYGLPPIIGEVGMGVTALLAGQKPAPIRLDFIQWAFRLLPLIPILQIDGVVSTFRRLNKWHQHREILPKYKHLWTQHILPPLIPNLALTGMLVTILANKMFGFIKLFMPDVSLITLLSGSFAGVWSVLRTGLLLRAWRKP
jgi:CubicO group peptidase (beta-lactamase class C family)